MRSMAIENPQVKPKYKAKIKLPRAGIKSVSIRGTQSYVFVEFESVNIPRIELEVVDD